MSLGKKDISLNIYTEAQILSSDSKKFLDSFLDLIKKAGYPDIKFDKEVDFEKMYSDKFN